MIKQETTNFVIGGEIVSTSLPGRCACATSICMSGDGTMLARFLHAVCLA